MTDPIADMLTRIRNANKQKFNTVDIPSSKIKNNIAEVLKNEGYIVDFEIIEDKVQPTLRLTLKYFEDGSTGISGLKRISKPGLRVYAKSDELPQVLNGLGVALISTSQGVLTDRQARQEGVGGEVLAYIW